MERNIFFLILIAVGFVITVPYAYSAVEPSIIINMEASQITKPLQIKDSLGAVIFSVDPSGVIFPSQGGEPLHKSTISYESPFEIIVAGNQQHNHVSNPLILYHVTINNNGLPDRKTLTMESLMIGGGERLTGAGTCFVGWSESQDNGVTWGNFLTDFVPTTFLEVLLEQNVDFYSTGTTDFAFVLYNDDGISTCSVTNIQSIQSIYEVQGYTYTRIL